MVFDRDRYWYELRDARSTGVKAMTVPVGDSAALVLDHHRAGVRSRCLSLLITLDESLLYPHWGMGWAQMDKWRCREDYDEASEQDKEAVELGEAETGYPENSEEREQRKERTTGFWD
ncbi:hypothetical protein KIPB_001683 [Kipferlia bialata]|uniref:Uncharacterized protein n=1 Tax=Kipferlia bialata TaxID=797122 RepID=A0A391NPA4_9EUKA|nr:hypothetical protein KIPB_001683 [Kipferlia bialata]|eukprot:g1683.t1